MVINNVGDLDRLPFPAAYTMTKSVVENTCTTTTIGRCIKVNNGNFLVICSVQYSHAPVPGTTIKTFQGLQHDTSAEVVKKFAGFEFKPSDLTFTANPDKDWMVGDV